MKTFNYLIAAAFTCLYALTACSCSSGSGSPNADADTTGEENALALMCEEVASPPAENCKAGEPVKICEMPSYSAGAYGYELDYRTLINGVLAFNTMSLGACSDVGFSRDIAIGANDACEPKDTNSRLNNLHFWEGRAYVPDFSESSKLVEIDLKTFERIAGSEIHLHSFKSVSEGQYKEFVLVGGDGGENTLSVYSLRTKSVVKSIKINGLYTCALFGRALFLSVTEVINEEYVINRYLYDADALPEWKLVKKIEDKDFNIPWSGWAVKQTGNLIIIGRSVYKIDFEDGKFELAFKGDSFASGLFVSWNRLFVESQNEETYAIIVYDMQKGGLKEVARIDLGKKRLLGIRGG